MISKGHFSNFSWLFSYIHFYERRVFEGKLATHGSYQNKPQNVISEKNFAILKENICMLAKVKAD